MHTQTHEGLINTLTELSLITTEKNILQDIENSPNFCDSVIGISAGGGIVIWNTCIRFSKKNRQVQ
jgi:hypothetical protein